VDAAQIDDSTEVLEVGPGLGVLTRLLAGRARRVVAVELDTSLAEALSDIPRVEVVNQDVLTFDPSDYFSGLYVVVANLPYHITSPALRHLLRARPTRMVVMVQAEVAERIAARPGAMSALAVAIQVQANVNVIRKVPADAFYPRPKVDSAVMVLTPIPEPAVPRDDLEAFVTLVQAGFKQPRKTLANSLAEGLKVGRDEAVQRLARAEIDP